MTAQEPGIPEHYFVCGICKAKCPDPKENPLQDPAVILKAWKDHKEETGHGFSYVVYPVPIKPVSLPAKSQP